MVDGKIRGIRAPWRLGPGVAPIRPSISLASQTQCLGAVDCNIVAIKNSGRSGPHFVVWRVLVAPALFRRCGGRGGIVAVFFVFGFAVEAAGVGGGLPFGEDGGLIAEFVEHGGVQHFEQVFAFLYEAADFGGAAGYFVFVLDLLLSGLSNGGEVGLEIGGQRFNLLYFDSILLFLANITHIPPFSSYAFESQSQCPADPNWLRVTQGLPSFPD